MVDRIVGDMILLCRMKEEDTDDILRWRNQEFVRNNFIYRSPFTREGHLNWISEMIETEKAEQFIIIEKITKQKIGSCYLRDIDHLNHKAEYGIFIGEQSKLGKGYGTEAAHLLSEYAFKHCNLNKLFLRVFARNRSAVKSYEKAGFVEEAYLKDELYIDEEYLDLILMAKYKQKSGENMKKVSFIIPCYRSEKTLEHVVNEIRTTMNTVQAYSYEIILVNDCSPDNTEKVIQKLCLQNSNIFGISFSKNYGQHAALMAGFRSSSGDIAICLDDDGQTPANEVEKLLKGIEEGADVVYAKYEHKMHSLFRNVGSKINDLMARYMLDKPEELYVSSYFAAKRFVVNEIIKYENSYPYVIGLVLRTTKNIINVPVNHRERELGTSGYTISKLMGLWLNGFTAFSVKPLRIATVIGASSAMVGFIYGIYTIAKRIFNPLVPAGFSSLMSALLFIGGMLMLMLGLIGEYIGRIYISMNNAPQYVIKETYKSDKSDNEKKFR